MTTPRGRPPNNENGPPRAVNTPTALNAVDANNRKAATDVKQPALTTAQQLADYVACVLEPADTVEIRRLPSKRSTWHRASELPKLAAQLQSDNAAHGIYIGVNPRSCVGDGSRAEECNGRKCGRCRLCVQLARSVFVDIDNVTLDAVLIRLRDSGLPAPTLIVVSGGGVHFYWRLSEPLADLDQWSEIQRRLIAILNSDLAVHDPPRVMRLPGFANHKYSPPRQCTIVEANAGRVYPIDEFELPTAPIVTTNVRAKSTDGTIIQGARNQTLMSLAGSIRARGCSEAGILAALKAENLARCNPRLSDSEIRSIAKSAGRYPAGSTVPTKPWIPFPVHCLPVLARQIVVTIATAIGCDPSMVALPFLTACAAAIGTTRRVILKNNWAEYCILWCALIAKSGQLKSPAHDHATKPLRDAQLRRLREYEAKIMEYKIAMLQYEVELSAWKRSKPEIRRNCPKEPKPPVCVRYIVSDTTVEALAPILYVNARGVLMSRDELAAWITGFNQYKSKGGSDTASWLELHRAGTVIVDRKTGGQRTIVIPHAAVSVCGTIQPKTLQRLLTREFFEAGLPARLLLAAPPARQKKWTEADVSQAIIASATQLIDDLLALEHRKDDFGEPIAVNIPLSPGARKLWSEWYDENAAELANTEDDDVCAALAKIEAYAARFALVFHCIQCAASSEYPTDSIGADSMADGIELARWFANEAEQVYGLWREPDDGDSLIRFIRGQGGLTSIRDLMRGPREFRKLSVDDVRKRLDALGVAGKGRWIRPAPGEQGGRPSACSSSAATVVTATKPRAAIPNQRFRHRRQCHRVNQTGTGNRNDSRKLQPYCCISLHTIEPSCTIARRTV